MSDEKPSKRHAPSLLTPLPEGDGDQTLRETIRRLGPAAPLAIAVTVLPSIGSAALIWIATTTALAPWMRDHQPVAMPLYIVSFWLLGICVLPTYAYSMLGGYAFGFWGGVFATTLAYAGACIAGFALSRRVALDRVVPLIERYPKLDAVRRVLAGANFKRSLIVIALLRLSPASPFAISNVVLGASGVRWPAFLLGSLIGVVPRTVALLAIVSRSRELSFKTGEGWIFLSLGVLVTVIVIGVIGKLARDELDRQVASHPINPRNG